MNLVKKLLMSLVISASMAGSALAMVPAAVQLAEHNVQEAIAGNGNFIDRFDEYIYLFPVTARQVEATRLLSSAIEFGDIEAMYHLMSMGACPNGITEELSPLQQAIAFGDISLDPKLCEMRKNMILVLLNYGAEFDQDAYDFLYERYSGHLSLLQYAYEMDQLMRNNENPWFYT